MTKTLHLPIAIALVATPILLNSAHAGIRPSDVPDEEVAHGAPSHVSIHELNPYSDERPVSGRSSSGSITGAGINYHGGPVMLGGVNVYVIWYGNWSGNTAPSIVTAFLQSLGGSPYYNINTSYYDGSYTHVLNSIHYAGLTTDSYSHGTSLSDSSVGAIVSSAISSRRLPADSKGVYFVLTSADVTETSGFCTQYCGWHTAQYLSGSYIKYAYVGNPARCPSSCAAQTVSPNGNAGADGMVSIIAHELEEANTDPLLNAWYDSTGAENADKCAWTFGSLYRLSSGAYYNVVLGGRYYLIQRNWVNANGGYC